MLKPTQNTRKIANKLKTVASGKINLQSKHDHTHVAGMIIFLSIFTVLFKSNASIKRKENTFYRHKENNICNIFRVLMLQQLLANKHDKLRDLTFRRVGVWVW